MKEGVNVMTENKEIIEKLEKLQSLLDESFELSEYVEHGCTSEYAEKVAKVVKTVDDLKGAPSVFSNLPSFPIDQAKYDESRQERDKSKKIFMVILCITIVCVLIFLISNWRFFNSVASIGILASIFFGYLFFKSNGTYNLEKKKYDDSVAAYEKSIKAFRNSLNFYDQEKTEGIAAAKEFACQYKEAYEEYDRLLKECVSKKADAMENFVEKMKEAKTYDFVPTEYYHLIRHVIKLLKSGRADNYKEALNLAIQEDKEEQAEAARRAEEAQRTQIMREQAEAEERRALEAQRHNQEMERQQQMHNKAMIEEQRAANRAAEREAARQASEARRAEQDMRNAASHMCSRCANASKCSGSVKGRTLNCGGYRPR